MAPRLFIVAFIFLSTAKKLSNQYRLHYQSKQNKKKEPRREHAGKLPHSFRNIILLKETSAQTTLIVLGIKKLFHYFSR